MVCVLNTVWPVSLAFFYKVRGWRVVEEIFGLALSCKAHRESHFFSAMEVVKLCENMRSWFTEVQQKPY